VPRQLSRLPCRDEAAAEAAGERAAGDVTARLGTEHDVRLARRGPPRDLIDGVAQRLRVAEQRHDVLEDDARLRKVGDVADLRLQIDGHARSLNPRLACGEAAQAPPEEELRQLLRELAERAEILEPCLAPLEAAGVQ